MSQSGAVYALSPDSAFDWPSGKKRHVHPVGTPRSRLGLAPEATGAAKLPEFEYFSDVPRNHNKHPEQKGWATIVICQ